MELIPLSLLLSLSLSTILFLLFRTSTTRRRNLRSPPGSIGLPLIGETFQLISAYKTENPEPFIDTRVVKYGTVFTTHVFGERTVFSADAETNRFILQNEGRLFESSYPGSIANLVGKHSLLLMRGSLHRRMHSLTMSFANSTIIKDHLLVDIDRLVRRNLDKWTGRILLMEEAKKITFELTLKQLLSIEPCEWSENLRKEYMLVIEGFFCIPLPFFSLTYRRAIQARKRVTEALHLVVRERRVEREKGVKKNDMLAALFDSDCDDDEIVDLLVSLLVAGYDTTSTTMTLAVKFLTDTPSALAELKEEHEEIRKKKGASLALEWDDYKSMPFTQCVVNETLRLSNIISGVFRRAITDVKIKDYTIPKGSKVFASLRAVHLGQENFEDARVFDPWRWQKISDPANFMPFGGGPRRCPGHELARVALSVFLHHLITRFSFGYGQAGGSQPSQPEAEPDVEVVPETQPEPVQETSKRGKRSHKKKDKDAPRRTKNIIKWTKEEEYTLTRAYVDISEDEETANFQTGPVFWDRVRALFFSTWGQGEHRDKDSISSKWTDINNKCHSFQEVFQRNYDNRPSGEGDVGVLTKSLEEFDRTKGPFAYYKCWELLRKSPKWAVVNPMTSSSRRRAKRSKTSSSVDPSTPTSDARNVDLNEAVDVDEGIQEELARPGGRRKGTGKKTVESSSDLELKEDFDEMNRRLQDIRDLGHQRYEIMRERMAETKKFNEMQEARQMEKDIEFLSKPIDHLQGDALILAQMRRQKIKEKYGL